MFVSFPFSTRAQSSKKNEENEKLFNCGIMMISIGVLSFKLCSLPRSSVSAQLPDYLLPDINSRHRQPVKFSLSQDKTRRAKRKIHKNPEMGNIVNNLSGCRHESPVNDHDFRVKTIKQNIVKLIINETFIN